MLQLVTESDILQVGTFLDSSVSYRHHIAQVESFVEQPTESVFSKGYDAMGVFGMEDIGILAHRTWRSTKINDCDRAAIEAEVAN